MNVLFRTFMPFAPVVLVALVATTTARAADDYDPRRDYTGSSRAQDARYTPSVAGGIAAPSESGLAGENPTGLIYNRRTSVLALLATGKDRPGSLSNGLAFLAGNGIAAATIGIQTYSNTSDDRGSFTYFNFGLATYAHSLNMAFGINGSYRFTKPETHNAKASEEPTWLANLGFLFNPYGGFRVGATIYDLSKNVTAVGVGISANFNRSSMFSLDASVNNKGKGLTLKPGIAVQAGSLSLTYAYGMHIDREAVSGISAGNTIGLGYEFNPTFKIQGYYNHVTPYYLGATVGF